MKLKPVQMKLLKDVVSVISKYGFVYLAAYPGVGKTLITLKLLKDLQARSALVIVNLNNIQDWKDEIDKWEPYLGLKKTCKFEFTTYQSLKKLQGVYKPQIVIVDEAHNYKSITSKRYKDLRKFIRTNKCLRVYLSGTPANKNENWFPIFSIENVFTNYIGFIRQYSGAILKTKPARNKQGKFFMVKKWTPTRDTNTDELHNILSNYVVRETDESLNLPNISFFRITIDMFDENMDSELLSLLYNEDYIKNADKLIAHDKSIIALEDIARIKREVGLLKSKAINKVCDKIKPPFIIFTHHQQVAENIKNDLLLKSEIVNGTKTKTQNKEAIRNFKNNKLDVLILSLISASEGLTLINTSRVLFAELPWNYTNYLQALKRVHRIGQKKPVDVYTVLLKDTFDEAIYNVMKKKKINHDKIFNLRD